MIDIDNPITDLERHTPVRVLERDATMKDLESFILRKIAEGQHSRESRIDTMAAVAVAALRFAAAVIGAGWDEQTIAAIKATQMAGQYTGPIAVVDARLLLYPQHDSTLTNSIRLTWGPWLETTARQKLATADLERVGPDVLRRWANLATTSLRAMTPGVVAEVIIAGETVRIWWSSTSRTYQWDHVTGDGLGYGSDRIEVVVAAIDAVRRHQRELKEAA